MDTVGKIHSFQSLGAVDGPGLRCVVFMQGCPLRCIYCHNPDAQSFAGGEEYTPEKMAQKILRYKPYIKDGGVTVSGGEPLMQPDFVRELFKILKQNNIHTALDTSGIGDLKKAKSVLEYADLVLADVKFLSDEDYAEYCKAEFSRVKDFLDLTQKMNIPLWIRQVIVPGINDSERNILSLKEFLKKYNNIEKTELLPFRKLCLPKYENLGMEFKLKDTPEMSEDKIKQLQKLL